MSSFDSRSPFAAQLRQVNSSTRVNRHDYSALIEPTVGLTHVQRWVDDLRDALDLTEGGSASEIEQATRDLERICDEMDRVVRSRGA